MENPLNIWIAKKIRGGKENFSPLTRDEISLYQVAKIRETLSLAKEKSSFYSELYKNIDPHQIKTLADVVMLPFINDGDIVENGRHMVTVRQDDIHRIVSLETSGTTDKKKRIYFTKEDQELTIDFFHHGMLCLTTPQDNFLILLPTKTPGSVGDLLRIGMERLGAAVIPYGLIDDYQKVALLMAEKKVTSLVGAPVQMLILAAVGINMGLKIKLESILLSTDYVPVSLTKRLGDIWGCRVFEHYGMTETGLGGGVFCHELCGYHMREADLYFEVVDSAGNPVDDGEYGELVFTTLTRRGMPLIRYKTGDWGRWLKEGCSCKSPLKLMDRVKSRIDMAVVLPDGGKLHIIDLDEAIFSVDGVIDYEANLSEDSLDVKIKLIGAAKKKAIRETEEKIQEIPVIKNVQNYHRFRINIESTDNIGEPLTALKKRKIKGGWQDGR